MSIHRARRIGSRNMSIVAPLVGPAEPREDLEKFETAVVLDTPSFANPHVALIERGDAWYDEGLDKYEFARRAQLLSGMQLAGRALEILASHAEEVHDQFQARPPRIEMAHD